jgi:hypothetical protein
MELRWPPPPVDSLKSPFASKQVYIQKPAAKKELVRKEPRGKYFQMLVTEEHQISKDSAKRASVEAETEALVNLENFEQEHLQGRRINSPASMSTMKTFGVLQQDLAPRTYEFFLDMCGGDEAVANMRYNFEERTRGRLLDKLRDERWRTLRDREFGEGKEKNLTALPFPDILSAVNNPNMGEISGNNKNISDGSELALSPEGGAGGGGGGSPGGSVAGGHRSWSSTDRRCTGVRTGLLERDQEEAARRLAEGVSVSGAQKSPWGRDRAFRDMSDVGSMVVAKSEERVKKIEAIQERRMQKMLSQSIQTLDRVEDAHEQFIAKIDRRQHFLEEEVARVRTSRTAAADKVQQQIQNLL